MRQLLLRVTMENNLQSFIKIYIKMWVPGAAIVNEMEVFFFCVFFYEKCVLRDFWQKITKFTPQFYKNNMLL